MTEDEESGVSFAVESKSPSVGTGTAKDPQSTATQEEEKPQNKEDEETKAETDTPSTTTAEERHAASESDPINHNSDAEEKASSPQPKVVDPIRMFGILVPPALRSAQASFKEAIEGPLIRLAEVTGELRALEREIGRARKSIRKA